MIDKVWNAAITSPGSFLLVCLGIGIVLWTSSKFIPDILNFICEITKILVAEFDKGRIKSAVEKLNAMFVGAFFVVLLLVALCELLPSAIKQAIGTEFESKENGHHGYFLLCFLCFLFICVISPLLIFVDRQEEAVRKLIQRALRGRR